MRPAARNLLLAALGAACTPPSAQVSGSLRITDAKVTGESGSQILEVDAEVFLSNTSGAEGYLDGASLVVTDRGEPVTFDAPALTATGFPVGVYAGATIHLEVPSPFADIGSFDSFCTANARSVTVTAQLYVPENDTDPDLPLPLVSATGTAPLVQTGSPPSNDIFATGSPSWESATTDEPPRPLELVPWQTGSLVFSTGGSNEYASDFAVYEVSPNGAIATAWTSPVFVEAPRLSTIDQTLYFAAPSKAGVVEVGQALSDTGTLWTNVIAPADQANDDIVIHASALSAHPGGLRVALQTTATLEGLEGFILEPPADRYYGSFLYEYDQTGVLLSAQPSARDVISMTDLADGGRIMATGELPPREEAPSLRIERLDPKGTPIFTHEEPALAYHATTTPLADGGILLSTEDKSLADTVVLVRLAADGTVLFRLRALGRGGSAAPRADGNFLWTFTGTIAGLPEPAAGSVPDRAVPLLLEVTADGRIGRAKQLGCSGWTAIGAGRSSGSSLLVGSLGELSAMGTQPAQADRDQIFAVRVD